MSNPAMEEGVAGVGGQGGTADTGSAWSMILPLRLIDSLKENAFLTTHVNKWLRGPSA